MEPTVKYENCEDMYVGPADIIPTGAGQKRHFNYLGGTNECDDVGGDQYKGQNLGFSLPQQPVKRYRRGEAAVLFSPPFFEVPENLNLKAGDTIIARCVSCRVVLRGHKNISSNFIKHMKRAHPEVYKMYDNYKILKQHGIVARPTNAVSAVGASEQGYFDPTAFLEALPQNSNTSSGGGGGAIENEQDSETNTTTNTENSQANSTADLNETIDNLHDSQLIKNQARSTNISSIQSTQQPEVNLSNKTLQAMSKLFDDKLKSFATKNELTEVTKNIMNQVRSRQTTPCSSTVGGDEEECDNNEEGADEKYKTLERELQNIRERLEQTEQSKRILQREFHLLEKIVRKRKLIISNLPIAPNQQPKAAVEQLLRERFGMPHVMLESVTVIGNRNRLNQDRQTLLVQIAHENDVNAIFRKSSCLRNTGIFIESQMSQISVRRKEKLLVLRREMLRRNSSLRIIVRNTQMLVCDTFFHWDDLLGLCMGNLDAPETELICGDEAIEELKKLTNLDMKEFLNVLKNYDIR